MRIRIPGDRRLRSDDGASVPEYAVLISLIAIVIILGLGLMGRSARTEFNCAGSVMTTKSAACTGAPTWANGCNGRSPCHPPGYIGFCDEIDECEEDGRTDAWVKANRGVNCTATRNVPQDRYDYNCA